MRLRLPVAQGQVTFLSHVSCPPKVLKTCVSYMDFSYYSCRLFGNGVTFLEFSMAVMANEDRNLQPPATKYQGLTTWKRNTMYVPNLNTCAYFIHAGHQPDPHRPVYLRVATEFK